MSVIINNKTYISGVSNVDDKFQETYTIDTCNGYDLTDYMSTYIQVEEIELRADYVNNFGTFVATIDFDFNLLIGKGYRVEVVNITRDINHTLVPLTGYVAISKDKDFWTENFEYEFNSIVNTGNVFIEDSVTGEPIDLLELRATLKIYKLSEYRVEYLDCNSVKNVIEIENEIVGQTIEYVEAPKGFPVSPYSNYSDKYGPVLINTTESPKCTESKLVQYIAIESTDYQSGYNFYYNWDNIGSIAFIDVKIEGIDGYCDFEIRDENGAVVGTFAATTRPELGFERFEITSTVNEYLKIIPTNGGANCDPITSTPTKLVMDFIIQSPENTDGVLLLCCPCEEIDFCGSDFVEIKFTNSCNEAVKLAFRGKLQGGVYKFAGEEFTTYSGERIRPTTTIEAQYTLVIFEYSDAFFLALQDIIANNLTMKIGSFEYYFFTSDITPTWDNFSEYGFASITLVRKDTIKKYRRNCCN